MGLSAVGFSSSLCRAFTLSNCLRVVEGVEDKQQSASLSLPTSHKWRMIIAYDGTKFSGWQYQESIPTIQCLVERALMQITKLERKDLCLVGASRTDAGVHACGQNICVDDWKKQTPAQGYVTVQRFQVAHFLTPFTYDDGLESLHAAVNGLLPSEIQVREISPAKAEFHARFSTISKIYHYKIYNNPVMDPFQYRYAYHSTYKLNPLAMREAAAYFVGKHDFTSFANAIRNNHVRDPVKEIFRFDVTEMDSVLQLEVEGSGFLYKQVRNMVALLVQIGREALPPNIVPKIIAARDRRELAKVALSAPAHGLCLVSVNYDHELLQPPASCPAISYGRTHQIRKCKLSFY